METSVRGDTFLIFLVNGAPASGKDLVCSYLSTKYSFKHVAFKDILVERTIEYFGVDKEWFMSEYNNRDVKEHPETSLNGFSRRSALIHVSEEAIKPVFGKDYFGIELSKTLNENEHYCISDCGFVEEIEPIINKFGFEVRIIQLIRENCTFKNDSRSYVYGKLKANYVSGFESPVEDKEPFFPIDMYRIHNNGTISNLELILDDIISKDTSLNAHKYNKSYEILRESI